MPTAPLRKTTPTTAQPIPAVAGAAPQHWFNGGVEPSIDDLLADLIFQALMQADGVAANEVRAALRAAGASGRNPPTRLRSAGASISL
jgi:hypothetical protein